MEERSAGKICWIIVITAERDDYIVCHHQRSACGYIQVAAVVVELIPNNTGTALGNGYTRIVDALKGHHETAKSQLRKSPRPK